MRKALQKAAEENEVEVEEQKVEEEYM